MKRITFLLLSFLMAVLSPNPVSAQNNSTLTLSVSDTPLNEILNKIEKKTSYSFQYSTQVIDVRQKRSIHVKNQPIEAVLNILLKGTDIQYHIKGKQIILNARKKETKKAPEKSKGIVMDSKTREPIIGASITVEGEKTGAISDIDGRFEIEAPEHSRLCVSYMGYVTQLVPVKANSLLEIWMSEDTKVIDEVVVVGYGAVSRKNLTTAIAQVKPEKIPQAATSNISQLLMGRAAGLQAVGVNALGMTGADMNILLSDKRLAGEVDYGYVGDVRHADGKALTGLIEMGVVPVIAPLTHDGKGFMLNTNADTMAGETAKALAPYYDVSLVYCFEKKGVLRDEKDDESVIPEIDFSLFQEYQEKGIIQGGMIPKLENAFEAIRHGVCEVIITRADCIGQKDRGTRIVE